MRFRIRKLYDDFLPANRKAIDQILEITEGQVADLPEGTLEFIRDRFRNPVYRKMKSIFLISDDSRGDVKGFAMMSWATDLDFCFLDLIAMKDQKSGSGTGSALYHRVQEEARHLGCRELYFEVLSDSPDDFPDRSRISENRRRLKFYERMGGHPLLGFQYEDYSKIIFNNPYYLVCDLLDPDSSPDGERVLDIVRAIAERRHPRIDRRSFVKLVQRINQGNPVLRKPPVGKVRITRPSGPVTDDMRIPLFYNENHQIHHIKDRGYVEAPVRIRSILDQVIRTGLFEKKQTRHFPPGHITKVHTSDFVKFFKEITTNLEPGKTLYPEVFPIRSIVKKPKSLISQAGYYSIDVFSPLHRNAYFAAVRGVDCALSAAREILSGYRIAYALIRPPGHHAGSNFMGGFCYLNSTAIAARFLSDTGKVAILDLDYHHGNGTQEIFYKSSNVLTLSIHGHPHFEYPHFSGYSDETGEGEGKGYNFNFPLPKNTDGESYRKSLKKALGAIKKFKPAFLVVALGLDTAKGDPTGTWALETADFEENGKMVGEAGIPVLVVQEGGYDTKVLGNNAASFFRGLHGAAFRK